MTDTEQLAALAEQRLGRPLPSDRLHLIAAELARYRAALEAAGDADATSDPIASYRRRLIEAAPR